jgi:hypothetical protein
MQLSFFWQLYFVLKLILSMLCEVFFFFFFLFAVMGFGHRPHICSAGTLPIKPHLQPWMLWWLLRSGLVFSFWGQNGPGSFCLYLFLFLLLRWDFADFLAHYGFKAQLFLSSPNSWDCSCEPPYLAFNTFLLGNIKWYGHEI